MENASKALIIAGSVLIGIIILSLAVLVAMTSGELAQAYDNKLSQDEINMYNNKYQKFARDLNAQEFVSLINYAEETNKKYATAAERQITIKVNNAVFNLSVDDAWRFGIMENVVGSAVGTEAQYIYKFVSITYNDHGLVDTLSYTKS